MILYHVACVKIAFELEDMERSTGGLPVRRPRTYMEARSVMWDEDWTRRIAALVPSSPGIDLSSIA